MEIDDVILFDARKNFTFVRGLGSGGTGSTFLFKDETTDILFAIKKYDPKGGNDPEECYDRFVDEIKILLKLMHPNIVRIFNYYLYPEALTGYLQMEFVSGATIDNYHPALNSKGWNDIFSDTVSAFVSIEQAGVLHRDIRPGNIMINNNGIVKVIDFGFGKQYTSESSLQQNSVLLNWAGSSPDEIIQDRVYNHGTEVYYLGKLFEGLVGNDSRFAHASIIEKMVQQDPANRFDSFAAVKEAMNTSILDRGLLTEAQKKLYRSFASVLVRTISKLHEPVNQIKDPNTVLQRLEKLLVSSSLETTIQKNSLLIDCFIKNSGYMYKTGDVAVELVREFYNLFQSLQETGRQSVLDNLAVRLGVVKVETVYDEDIPF